MRARGFAAPLLAFGALTLTAPAYACVYTISSECIGGPCEGPAFERQQRIDARQAWRTQQRQWRRDAERRVDLPSTDHAADLVRTLIPLPRAEFAEWSSCGLHWSEEDRAGYLRYEDSEAWSRAHIDPAVFANFVRLPARLQRDFGLPSNFSLNLNCNVEYRNFVSAELVKRVSPRMIRRLWLHLANQGFLIDHHDDPLQRRREQALGIWSRPNRSGPIMFDGSRYFGSGAYGEVRRSAYVRLEAYFRRDAAARTMFSAIIEITATRDPAMPDTIICPNAAAAIAAEIDMFRSEVASATAEIERQRALQPVH